MKKRILTFAFALLMVVCLAVPTLAVQQMYDYGGLKAPDFRQTVDMDKTPYAMVVGSYLYVNPQPITWTPLTTDKVGKIHLVQGGAYYRYSGDTWTLVKSYPDNGAGIGTSSLITWSNHDVLNHNTGTLVFGQMKFKLFGVEFEDWSDYYGALTKQITVQNVVAVLVVGSTAVIGLVFLWWGSRKAVRAIMSAFRKGRISL